ncbi:MAG TPA: ABC transporter ATP-binding protein [Candidatus Methylomirabilis sp.]|nr:ABC transporter ATP-binding protein [Candidatus Methylomirabilis sp.]
MTGPVVAEGRGAPPPLRVRELDVFYGEAQVLHRVSMQVTGEEIVAVVGPNGSGKSTLLRTIQGLQHPRAGSIQLGDERIDGLEAHEVVARGLTSIPEGRRLFQDLSVRENLEIGAYRPAARSRMADSLREVHALFPILLAKDRSRASALSGGEQQMLALGRGLMARPMLFLLDDPFIGLAPRLIAGLCEALRALATQRIGILIAGQHVGRILGLADRAYLLEQGRITEEAPGKVLLTSPSLRRALLRTS